MSNNKLKIIFNFKSFHPVILKAHLIKVIKKINLMKIKSNGIASLPTKTERFTVLTSPHIDKKSREQFEIKTYKKTLSIIFNDKSFEEKKKAYSLVEYIKNSTSGIQLNIIYKSIK